MLELSGGSIDLCQPKAQRLVLCVKPGQSNALPGEAGVNHLFLGFSTVWERNLWFCWLKEVKYILIRTCTVDKLLVTNNFYKHLKHV